MDWSGLDEVEATELLLRSALQGDAECLSIARDNRGASVFFMSGERLETFDHIPAAAIDPICRYVKNTAGIDPYKAPPQEGFAAVELDGRECTLVVNTLRGSVGEDIAVRITRM